MIVLETLQVDREIRHGINYGKAVAQGIILTDEREVNDNEQISCS